MDPSSSVKRLSVTKKTNFNLCIICQETGSNLVIDPAPGSLNKLLECVTERAQYGDPGYLPINSRLQDITSDDYKQATWHRSCYQDATHSGKISRAKERYKKSQAHQDACLVSNIHKGRPVLPRPSIDETQPNIIEEKHFTRASAAPYSKDQCFFCCEDSSRDPLHEVSSYNVGRKIKEAVENSNNNDWKVRLQPLTPDDARAIDIKYHRQCYVSNVLRASVPKSKQGDEDDENEHLILADIEFISLLQYVMAKGEIFSLDELTEAYKSLLMQHGASVTYATNRRVKKMIQEYIPAPEFSRPHRNKAEIVCCKAVKDITVGAAYLAEAKSVQCRKLFEAAHIVRRDINQKLESGWHFEGSLTAELSDFIPHSLYGLLRWIMEGPKTDLSQDNSRSLSMHSAAVNIAQSVMYEMKSHRQVQYSHTHPDADLRHRSQKVENPKVLGVGLKVHSYTRSKKLIDFLHANSVSVDYSRIMRLETQLAETVLQQMSITKGMYIPPGLKQGKHIFFAADNIDFQEDTPDGKNTLHGTMMAVFQQDTLDQSDVPPVKLTLAAANSHSLNSVPLHNLQPCDISGAPKPRNNPKYNFELTKHCQTVDDCLADNKAWLMSRSVHRDNGQDQKIPVWAAYNSLANIDNRPLTNIHILPMIPSPPNEWPTLIAVLKQAQGITTHVLGPEGKTVITFDMDLYTRALKLQILKPGQFSNVVLRIGEFHTVLCALRALGSLIEGSGIEQTWIEAGLYGPTTTRQILEGKHVKRALDAHCITLEAINELLLREEKKPVPGNIPQLSESLSDAFTEHSHDYVKNYHETVVASLRETQDFQDFLDVNTQHPMFKFLWQYMYLVSILLVFIRASREGLWLTHLESLEKLCPLFFSQNRLQYAQYVPEYLGKMHSLKLADPSLWDTFIQGNFCVKKSHIAFTSIGVDHALEQENKKMKIMGGLKGLTYRQTTLTRFFLVAPELARLSSEADTMCGIKTTQAKHHHQLSKAVTDRHEKAIAKLKAVLTEADPFQDTDGALVTLVHKTVMPDVVKEDILKQYEVGESAFSKFVSERVQGPVNLWQPMTKIKLHSWTSSAKKVTSSSDNHMVELKENRALFARLAVVAKLRPDIDIGEALGTYEFSSVPRSLFALDGSLLPSGDKSKLLHILENLPESGLRGSPTDNSMLDKPKALIVDGMVVVQQYSNRQHDIKSCQDLAGKVIGFLKYRSQRYDRLDVVFDHYNENSLKTSTRNRRKGRKKTSNQVICSDATPIRIPVADFLNNIKTKASLTEYLAEKILDHFKTGSKTVIVSTASGSKSFHTDAGHLSSTQEEADTKLILHSVDANQAGYSVDLYSVDTDVFILALRRLEQIGFEASIYLGVGDKMRQIFLKPVYEALGEDIVAALPGFHAFTGTDNTGRFAGKGKQTCWKTLQSVKPSVLKAFAELGKAELVSEEIFSSMEEFVCLLYQPKTKLKDVGQLRWLLFRQSNAEAEKLPPTKATLWYHTLRAHYQAMIWCNECTPVPNLSQPDNYGWKRSIEGTDISYVPVINMSKPAPDSVLQMARCGCTASKCSGGRCSCIRQNMICTEMCRCEGSEDTCENTSMHYTGESDDDTESDETDE